MVYHSCRPLFFSIKFKPCLCIIHCSSEIYILDFPVAFNPCIPLLPLFQNPTPMIKNLLILALSVLFWLPGRTQSLQQAGDDILAIKKIIQTAYVEGLQNEGDTVKINLGFHPGFEMLIPGRDGELKKFSITDWKKKTMGVVVS